MEPSEAGAEVERTEVKQAFIMRQHNAQLNAPNLRFGAGLACKDSKRVPIQEAILFGRFKTEGARKPAPKNRLEH